MRTLLVALLLFSAAPAYAQVHGGDVELQVIDHQIVTNATVYGAELGEIIPNEVDEPGFDSLAGTFPSGSSIGFQILDALRIWDGADFDTIPAETMSIVFGTSLGPVTTPATPGVVNGFPLNVASDGSWHRHYDFVLNSPASTGIYLLQLQLSSSDARLAASDPFYLVFNQNDSELNHDAAIAFIEAGQTVPEPTTLLLVAVGGVGLLARRRR